MEQEELKARPFAKKKEDAIAWSKFNCRDYNIEEEWFTTFSINWSFSVAEARIPGGKRVSFSDNTIDYNEYLKWT